MVRWLGVGWILASVVAAGTSLPALAEDQPIDATRLLLKQNGGRERLLFVSHDRRVHLPRPAAGERPEAVLELFSHATGEHALLPFGRSAGRAAWQERPGARKGRLLRYTDARPDQSDGGIQRVVHRSGRMLLVVGRRTGLDAAVAHGGVGVRLTVGDTRVCALFGQSHVRRDRPGLFAARGARASELPDCSDAALRGGTASPSTSTTTTSTSTTSTSIAVPGDTFGAVEEFADASDHSPGFLVGTRVELPMAATLTHVGVIGKAGGPQVRLGLYADVAGEPTALVAGTGAVGLVDGRLEIPVPATPLAAGPYWIMAVYDQPASVGIDMSDPTVPVKYAEVSFPAGLPTVLPFAETFFGQQFNYYVRVVP